MKETAMRISAGEAAESGQPTALEVMAGRELGEPFCRDALNDPVLLLDEYGD
jgi:hypothetical protein